MSKQEFLDQPPSGDALTDYDRRHLVTYLRLLDADEEGAAWEEIVSLIFGLDPVKEAARAERVHRSHLARARWMMENGYRDLIRSSYQ